ncbi:putative aldo-keto reductase 1 [Camellia lanceoleosa]|uniref:Aldo-keto reductase 1 n=1 Tax=Camellia lanceoleosa TaxID=1840588 RepID=A0ACC0IAZ7_9ERIC|nr:putative aldo-keto reductase 1 [Camellia lanceoleosa]
MADFEMPRVRLGIQRFEKTLPNAIYNSPAFDEDGITIIKYAFSKGITFFDTSNIYGVDHSSEILVGKLATKFGIVKMEPTQVVVKGTVEYVRFYCDASLKRLGVDYIDLYYVHWIYRSGPIEETQMGELQKLVEEGKIKYIGLSEASPNTIRRAHVVHPITALQMEYFLWTRDIEEGLIPLCRELRIAIVPYSPTAHGFFAGKAIADSVPTDSLLLYLTPHCTYAGITEIKNLDENIGALRVKLTEDDLKEISDVVPTLEITGPRIYKSFARVSYIFADTPLPKNSK